MASSAPSGAAAQAGPEWDAVRSDDDERVALSGAPRRDEPGRRTPARSVEQGHEALVLDELDAAEPGRALRAAVPDEAPDVVSSWASHASRP